MTRKKALTILLALGYCNAGEELTCENCPLTGKCDVIESDKRIAEAVRIMEKEL